MKQLRLCVAVLAFAAGCARIPIEPYAGAPVVLPHDGESAVAFATALKRRLADVPSFRGKGIIRIEPPRQRARQFDFLIMAERDRGMRLRATRAIGPVYFELIADETQFAVSIPPRREFYLGDQEAGADPQSAVLDPSGILDPLRLSLIDDSTRRVVFGRNWTVLREYLPGGEGSAEHLVQETAFDRKTGLVQHVATYDAAGALLQSVAFAGYRALDGLSPDNAFPMKISVNRAQAGFKVELQFREVKPNPTIPVAAFDMAPPKGFRVKPVAELDPNKVAQMDQEPPSDS